MQIKLKRVMKQYICRKIIYIVNIHRYLHFATVLQVTMDMFTRFATRVFSVLHQFTASNYPIDIFETWS